MEKIIDIVNSNSGLINLIFSGLVTISTIVYSILTWKLVSETRRMRKAQTDAKITLGIMPSEFGIHFINLIIKNEGVGPAFNIKFKISSERNENKKIMDFINNLGFIENGLKYLSQGSEIKVFLTSMLENYDEKINACIAISVDYETSSGEKIKDKSYIDFSIYKGLRRLGKQPLVEISENIETISKSIKNIESGWSKIKIVSYTPKDIEEQHESFLESHRDYIKHDDD